MAVISMDFKLGKKKKNSKTLMYSEKKVRFSGLSELVG